MRKIIALLCVSALLLAVGCNGKNETESEVPSESVSEFTPEDRLQANLRDHFFETEDGCYYQCGEYIYFIPRGGDTSYPLCGKPNCTHDDENCNAWCGAAFGYYNKSLYAVSPGETARQYDIVKMNLDGTEHEVVAQIEQSSNGTAMFFFHHGLLYFYLNDGSVNTMPEEQADSVIIMDLSDFSCTQPFEAYFSEGNRCVPLHFFEKKYYGYSDSYREPDAKHYIVELNAEAGEARELVEVQIGIAYATQTTYYYLEPDSGFRELDLASGELKDCGLPVEDAWWAAYDEEYIYLMGHARNGGKEHTLSILTRDYVLLDQIELTQGIYYHYVSTDRIYFAKNFTEQLTHYINKADIGSGELELKEMT